MIMILLPALEAVNEPNFENQDEPLEAILWRPYGSCRGDESQALSGTSPKYHNHLFLIIFASEKKKETKANIHTVHWIIKVHFSWSKEVKPAKNKVYFIYGLRSLSSKGTNLYLSYISGGQREKTSINNCKFHSSNKKENHWAHSNYTTLLFLRWQQSIVS